MSILSAPYYPIIYVRGYAMTRSEIEATTATPFMGFNLGATKVRQAWDGHVEQRFFESPLIRLMKDHGYVDACHGDVLKQGSLPVRSVFIHRYYDQADSDFADGDALSIEEAAAGLRDLIGCARDLICGEDNALRERFRVHLVAHSMGGLVCRCLLQNRRLRDSAEAKMVDKVFTYATPHNGIDVAGINVPRFLGIRDINNFNRRRIADYLSLDRSDNVSGLGGHFDPQRFFCLVGTNSGDYAAAGGLSRRLAGTASDGLVKIENASVKGARRAFVYRSHSGPFGIVNSEEGYQNLVRFLFGDVVVDGELEVEALPLPPSIEKHKRAGRVVRASYLFEASVSVRDGDFLLSQRTRETRSAIFRSYDELLKPAQVGREGPRSPRLFSLFLDSRNIAIGNTLVFAIDLAVSATEYQVGRAVFGRHRLPGENLYRENICIRATHDGDGWRLRSIAMDENWSEGRGKLMHGRNGGFDMLLSNRKGFRGRLRLMPQKVDAG